MDDNNPFFLITLIGPNVHQASMIYFSIILRFPMTQI